MKKTRSWCSIQILPALRPKRIAAVGLRSKGKAPTPYGKLDTRPDKITAVEQVWHT